MTHNVFRECQQIGGPRETFLVLLHLIKTVYTLEEVQSGDWGVSEEIFRNGRGRGGGVVAKDGIYK